MSKYLNMSRRKMIKSSSNRSLTDYISNISGAQSNTHQNMTIVFWNYKVPIIDIHKEQENFVV